MTKIIGSALSEVHLGEQPFRHSGQSREGGDPRIRVTVRLSGRPRSAPEPRA